KRSKVDDYRMTNRGGKGVNTLNITEKTGKLIAIKPVKDTDHLMVINKSGVAIRTAVHEMRVVGRATQGVRIINLRKDDEIAAVAKVSMDEVDEELNDENIDNEFNANENQIDSDNNSEENNILDSESNE